MFFKNENGEIFNVENFSSFQLEAKFNEKGTQKIPSSRDECDYLWSVWGHYTSGTKVILFETGKDKTKAQEFIMYLVEKLRIFDKYKIITINDFLNR